MTNHLNNLLRQSITTATNLLDSYRSLFDEIKDKAQDLVNSAHSIPEISRQISNTQLSSVQALQLINTATYDNQRLSNLVNVYYTPRLNELFFDIKQVVATLDNEFYQDTFIQSIKTTAEKERKRATFGFELDTILNHTKSLDISYQSICRFVSNNIFALDRLQRMVELIDRVQGKDLWLENKANQQTDDIMSNLETADDFDEFI